MNATPPIPPTLGTLDVAPAQGRPDLLGAPVAAFLATWDHSSAVGVAPIDPDHSDTAAFCAAYDVPLAASANCVVVGGRREGVERVAACVVLATTRADVNGCVKRLIDTRKASFLPMEEAVSRTGMEFGGITPLGLPTSWSVLIDSRVLEVEAVVIGSGVRRSKLVIAGRLLAELPGAEVIDGLANG